MTTQTDIKRQHTKYPKIGGFKDVYHNVTKYMQNDEAKVIKFTGTVKLHGTNAAVARKVTPAGIIEYALSRNGIITVDSDNAGFAFFHEANRHLFTRFFDMMLFSQETGKKLWEKYHEGYIVSIFGEWCGGNIQGKVALKELSKRFVVFGVKVADVRKNTENPDEEFTPSTWLKHDWIKSEANSVYNIHDFKTYEIEVDFNAPHTALEEINRLTLEVEEECPFAKHFGVSGLGEGIVWQSVYTGWDGTEKRVRFKSKGEKHTGKSVTTQKPAVDLLVLENINKFVDYAVTEGRLTQAIQNVVGIGNEENVTMKHLGDVIKWMRLDIQQEELQTISDNNLELNDVTGAVCKRTKEMFIKRMNSF